VKQPVVVLAAVMIWAGSYALLGSEDGGLAREIESASGVLLSEEDPSRAAVQEALTDLLEGASELSDGADLPAPAPERLAAAAASYAEGGFLEREAVAKVHRAYEAVKGRAFEFPDSVGSIPEAREHGRQQLQSALDALEAGRPREAILEVLGFVLLVTTPMEQPR